MRRLISAVLCFCLLSAVIVANAESISSVGSEISNEHNVIDMRGVSKSWYDNYFGEQIVDSEESEVVDEQQFAQIQEEDQSPQEDDEIVLNSIYNTYTGWQSCGTMTSERSYMSSAVIDDNIYTFGGTEDGVVVDNTEVYDTSTEVWYRKTPMPQGRYKHTALSYANKVYICGGYDENNDGISNIDVYNQLTDSWETAISTPNNNTNYGAGIYNGEIYIFGGKENGTNIQKIYKYDIANDEWKYITESSYLGQDDVVLSAYGGFRFINNWRIYDFQVSNDIITAVDDIPRQVYDYAAINFEDSNNNLLYVIGGRDNAASGVSVTSVKYRSDGDTWSYVDNWAPEWYNDLRLIRGLSCHNVIAANGYMYVFGGQVVYGEDQKLMFKRSLHDTMDDYPDDKEYPWARYVYGSINGDGDHDIFIFEPETSGYYEIKNMTPIHSNNTHVGNYGFNITIKEVGGHVLVGGYYPIEFGAVYMEAGKTYRISIFDIEGVISGNYMYQTRMVADDLPDSISDAYDIPLEQDINKSFIGRTDVDCVKFTIPVSGEYNINFATRSDPENSWKDTWAYIKVYNNDDEPKLLYSFSAKPSNEQKYYLSAGTYRMSFQPYEFYYRTDTSQYSFSINNVSRYRTMYENRLRHDGEVIDGNLYIISGLNNQFNNVYSIEKYTPSTHLWAKVNTDSEIYKDASISSVNNMIYTFGGYSSNTYKNAVKYYDTVENEWNEAGQLTTNRGRAACAVKGNSIYVIGGRNDSGYLDDIEIYDTTTNNITGTLSLPEAMIEPQAFFVDNTLYIIGGITYDGYSDKVYALENGSWVQKTSMPYASEYVRGQEYENNFFCGAVNQNGNVDILKYDPNEDLWTSWENNLVSGLIYYGFDILNGNIYITGGYSTVDNAATNNVYVCDCVTDISSMSDVPIRTIGFEYEQQTDSTVTSPEIKGVNAKVIDADKGIYELYLDEDDYEIDVRSIPFFFWTAREGAFRSLSDNYQRVLFYADPNTGDRKVKVVVGVGDGRGYSDKKAFYLTGNSENE